ncbi:MAG: response regulator [Candidatus Paceibacterota bacterium]
MAEVLKNKILIIEDDSYISDMYKIKLESEGFIVNVANDGQKGVEQLNKEKPDLILLDVVMPKMDGFSVLQNIKEDPEVQDIPVIMLTNLGQKDSVEKGLKLGAADYIIKAHFTPLEVVEKVREFLNK